MALSQRREGLVQQATVKCKSGHEEMADGPAVVAHSGGICHNLPADAMLAPIDMDMPRSFTGRNDAAGATMGDHGRQETVGDTG